MNKMKKIIIPILIIAMFFCIMPKIEYAAETYKVGDINGDGIIDSRDTLRELEYIAATTIPKIGNNHPEWKKYIENKWSVEPTAIKLDKTNMTIYKGKVGKINATITPTNATNKIIKWNSSNPKVATVDGLGNITGISNGISIITATTSNGKKATCIIRVNIPPKSISLSKTNSAMNIGDTLKLIVKFNPTNTSSGILDNYRISNPTIKDNNKNIYMNAIFIEKILKAL